MAAGAKFLGAVAVGFLVAGAARLAGGGKAEPKIGYVKKTTRKPRSTNFSGLFSSLAGLLDSAPGVASKKPAYTAPIAQAGSSAPTGGVPARLMGDLMRDFGFTSAQAAGIVGNLAHESGGFESLQEINPTVAGSRGGFGYAQWTGPRRREFESWSARNGLDVTSYDANYGFLNYELTNTWEKKAVDQVRRTNTPGDAAAVFSQSFLRPGIVHMDSRVSLANEVYGGFI